MNERHGLIIVGSSFAESAKARQERIDMLAPDREALKAMTPSPLPECAHKESELSAIRANATLSEQVEARRAFIQAPALVKGRRA